MKKVRIGTAKKLSLNKKTIVALDPQRMEHIIGASAVSVCGSCKTCLCPPLGGGVLTIFNNPCCPNDNEDR